MSIGNFPFGSQAARKSFQMDVVNPPNRVEIDLGVHVVAPEEQGLGRLQAALLDAQRGLPWFVRTRGENAERVNQAEMVEAAVRHAGMIGVAEQVVHPVHAEGVADNDLGKDGFPGRKCQVLRLGRADGEFHHVERPQGRRHRVPDLPHLRREDDLPRESLVVPAFGKKFFLGRVREGKVSHVMAQSGHAKHPSPVPQRVLVADFGETVLDRISDVGVCRHHFEYPFSEFHHAQGVLEPFVRGRRIEQRCEPELVDMSQPLEWPRVQHRTLVRVQADEGVDRVADFVKMLAHRASRAARRRPR